MIKIKKNDFSDTKKDYFMPNLKIKKISLDPKLQ